MRPYRSIPSRIKKFAKVNITALAKRGLKLHPRFHLKITLPSNEGNLETIVKFFNRNRMRIVSLKKLSLFLGAEEIIPLLLTNSSIRPLLKAIGQRLSRLSNLESAEIGSSNLNAFSIEEILIDSLTKMKKLKSLSLGVPDNQVKINFIAKKLVNMKTMTRLELNFFVANTNAKPIINNLKYCSRIQYLTVNLTDCSVNSDLVTKLGESIKYMKKLERVIIRLDRTEVQDEELKFLYETLESHKNISYFKVYMNECSEISFWLKARIYAKENFNNRC